MIGLCVEDFENQIGHMKYSLLPRVHRGEIIRRDR